jgi:hypothetical protein
LLIPNIISIVFFSVFQLNQALHNSEPRMKCTKSSVLSKMLCSKSERQLLDNTKTKYTFQRLKPANPIIYSNYSSQRAKQIYLNCSDSHQWQGTQLLKLPHIGAYHLHTTHICQLNITILTYISW